MRLKSNILGIYDLLLATGAIYTGLLMITKSGNFSADPNVSFHNLSIHNWVVCGIIAIFLFGLGNMSASIVCFLNQNRRIWLLSGIMGVLLLLTIIAQIIVFGELYLATFEIMILGLVQMALSISVYFFVRKSGNYLTASRKDELL